MSVISVLDSSFLDAVGRKIMSLLGQVNPGGGLNLESSTPEPAPEQPVKEVRSHPIRQSLFVVILFVVILTVGRIADWW